ncbi:MAG: aminomethyl transferase family protein [Chloroflexi bacterium]|nr:aminomethyl transferase family protein [Chloroflexota bacterium]
MNKTPLRNALHRVGATFAELFGWEVASAFGDIAAEYQAAREGVALLDRSHLGRFKVTGKDALDLLNRLTSNKVDILTPGTGAGTILPTNKGRVIDLLHLFFLPGHLLMLTSPQTRQRVAEWIDLYTFLEEITVKDETDATAMLAVLGPQAATLLHDVTNAQVERLEHYGSVPVTVGGVAVTLLRSDPLDTQGYDLVMPAEQAEAVWETLAGHPSGPSPLGEIAYNALRIEAGLPRYGWELSEEVNPWEVNLRRYIHFEKGCYVGQEVILRLNTYQKVQRHLRGLALSSPGVKEGARLSQGGKEAGIVTSVAKHPVSGEAIGLGLVRAAFATPGSKLEVVNDQHQPLAEACVQALPSPVGVSS